MIRLLIMIVRTQMFLNCTGVTIVENLGDKSLNDNNSDSTVKVEQIKNVYQKLALAPNSIKYQQNYFEVFPNTFYSFNQLFGYSNNDTLGGQFSDFASPLYQDSYLYVDAFLKLTVIPKTEYYNRMIDISINGKWYADGVNYFQHGMKNIVGEDLYLLCELLAKRNGKEVKSFWYFYFDGPHPDKKIPEEFVSMKISNPQIYSIMEEAHLEVLKNVNH